MNKTDSLDSSHEHKNEELVKRTNIEDSPFEIITINNEHWGVIGKYRITEKSESKYKIQKQLKDITWNMIVTVILVLMQENLVIHDEIKREMRKTKKRINP